MPGVSPAKVCRKFVLMRGRRKEESNSRIGGCGNCGQGQGVKDGGMGSDLRIGSVCRELILSNLKFFSFVILSPP